MLNDFFITRDVIGFLKNYLVLENINLPHYAKKLDDFGSKQHISFQQWWDLLDELEVALKIPALGLEIGRHIKVEHCGVLGYLFRTSRNLGEALLCFKRFQRLIYAGSQAEIKQVDRQIFCIEWDPDFGYSSQLSDELLLSSMTNITRDIIFPHHLSLAQVTFTQAISENSLTIYESFFECPVLAKQRKLSISFQVSDLSHPVQYEDQNLHSLLGKQAEALLKHLPEDEIFIVELRDTVIRCLHEGRADASVVANQLNISVRTLHRRLQDKNRIYREVLKDIRKSMALKYLSDHKLTLAEVALLLGYSDQSTFSRAFSTWYGKSPLQYKHAYL
ncbi:MAG: AraC-like DNA-binding protein [Pseudohongiellaceae bacterium]|jgi:AraC-like DNA-binding protein